MKYQVHYGLSVMGGFKSFGFVEVEAPDWVSAYDIAGEMQPNEKTVQWLSNKPFATNPPKVANLDMHAVALEG